MVNNSSGAKKGRDTKLAKDPDFFKRISAMRKSFGNSPFKDPVKAREAANIRWAKHKSENSDSRANTSKKESA